MNAPANLSELDILNAGLDRVQRCFDAPTLNAIVNDPGVRPAVGGAHLDPLDLTEFVKNPQNIALIDDGAVALFTLRTQGLYEVHSMALPERRGAHVVRATRAFLHWMFTRTNAVEIATRVPSGNMPALASALANGFEFEFERPEAWITPEGAEPAKFYSLSLQRWMARAPGLEDRGSWFHAELEKACERAGVEVMLSEESGINRYIGAACEMMFGGQPVKAVHFYNRFAAVARVAPLVVISADEMVVAVGDYALRIDPDYLEVTKSQ